MRPHKTASSIQLYVLDIAYIDRAQLHIIQSDPDPVHNTTW